MKRNDGFTLILALLMMAVVAILVFGTAFTTMVDRKVSANQQGSSAAYYVAQSGLQQYKTLVFQNLVDYYEKNQEDAWCQGPLGSGIVDNSGNSIEQGTWTDAAFVDSQNESAGYYEVMLQSNAEFIILTAKGHVGTSTSTVQLVATSGGGASGAWDNAIFATGQAAGVKKINGNVSVYGSIHIVNGVLELDTNIGLDGTAGIYNGYEGDDGEGNSDIRSLMQRVTGSSVAGIDLCAKVKIEEGDLALHGNAHVGTKNNPVYSIHIGKGEIYGDKHRSKIIADHHQSNQIHLRYPEGAGAKSDYAGYDVPFPELPSNFPNDSGLELAQGTCPAFFEGNVVTLPPKAASASCISGANKLVWQNGVLQVEGVIKTGGASLSISELKYVGSGVLQVGRCLDPIRENGTACANPDKSVTAKAEGDIAPVGGYPTVNALAIVSSGDVSITNKNNEVTAMMVYTAGDIKLDKQTLVTGSVVGASFDLGDNVPKVAYHPEIRNVAGKLCLPGSFTAGTSCTVGIGPKDSAGGANTPLSQVSYERR